MMMTGMRRVSDIFCVVCGLILGWKFVRYGYEISRGSKINSTVLSHMFQLLIDFRRRRARGAKSTRKGNSYSKEARRRS